MPTRHQTDALRVLSQVEAIAALENDAVKQRYATLANRFAILIRTNGLQQTLGFIYEKGNMDDDNQNNAENRLLRDIADNLSIEVDALNRSITEWSQTEYIFYTRRCLEFANLYRQFCESLLGDEEDNENDSPSEQDENPSVSES